MFQTHVFTKLVVIGACESFREIEFLETGAVSKRLLSNYLQLASLLERDLL